MPGTSKLRWMPDPGLHSMTDAADDFEMEPITGQNYLSDDAKLFTKPGTVASFNGSLAEYIEDNFHQFPPCNKYAENPKKPGICCCGRKENLHSGLASVRKGKWSYESLKRESSGCYGTIKFPLSHQAPNRAAPFLRVAANDEPGQAAVFIESVLQNSSQKKFTKPSLILSITGGAANFDLPPRLLESIRKGLIDAADSTDAWIITGGTDTGVMKLIGALMSETAYDKAVPIIGVLTWGILNRRELLTGETLEDRLDVEYTKDADVRLPGLDTNHNIFVLVDDGTEGQFGGEIAFRTRMEREAADRMEDPMIVTVIIQGGPGSLKTCRDSVAVGTPIVVVAGTGQAADILAYAWKFLHGTSREDAKLSMRGLRALIRRAWPKSTDESVMEDFLVQVFEVVDDANKVIIYNVTESSQHIDEAILRAVFQSGSKRMRNKLRQAMRWNRLDIAREALSSASHRADQVRELATDLNDNLVWALKRNSPEFVEMYLTFGAEAYLMNATEGREKSSRTSVNFIQAIAELYKAAAKDPVSHVRHLFEQVKSRSRSKSKSKSKTSLQLSDSMIVWGIHDHISKLIAPNFKFEHKDIIEKILDDPKVDNRRKNNFAYNMLMIYAVVVDKFRLAEKFWLRGDQSVPNALVASRLLFRMADSNWLRAAHLAEERVKMKYNSKKFEDLAVGVLQQCYKSDSQKTGLMLYRPIKQFSNQNCIQVAYEAENLQFLSHTATQNVIDAKWFGRMDVKTSALRIMSCVFLFFLPFLIPLLIKFRTRNDTDDEDDENTSYMNREDANSTHIDTSLSTFEQIRYFYKAPYTRFWIDSVAFVALLCLHSFVVLSLWEDSLSFYEIILAVWFLSLLFEEFRQLKHLSWHKYKEDGWNNLDMMIIILYFASFFFRVTGLDNLEHLVWAKAIMSLNGILMFGRLARYYAVNKQLGPKLIMLRDMGKDVVAFVCLLLIFLISYGIAAQSLLFPIPQQSAYWTFANVFYRPYFSIYGELFLDEIENDTDCIGPFPFSSCGWKLGWIVPMLLAIYLLVTNILLVNLLIAMFNQTYIAVEEQAGETWRMQNYELYLEYKTRPLLPAPLILISHFLLMLEWLFGLDYKFWRGKLRNQEKERRVKSVEDMLHVFQETNTDRYYHMTQVQKAAGVSEVLKIQSSRITSLEESLESLQDLTVSIREKILAALEGSALSGSQSTQPGASSPEKVTVKASQVDWFPPLDYPTTSSMDGQEPPRRIYVVPENRPWSVKTEQYSPPSYTSEYILAEHRPKACDPPLCDVDAVRKRAKESLFPLEIKNGVPLNPKGRTGMAGRGTLWKWGPNFAADPIVTRWRRTENGDRVIRDGSPVLEFVAIKRKEGLKEWAIPGGFVEPGDTVSFTLRKEFMEEALGEDLMTPEEKGYAENLVNSLFADGELVEKDFSRDPRNTDNAWIETTAYNFHDPTGEGVGKFQLRAGDDAERARWRVIHRYQRLYASHMQFIEKVARKHGAYW